MKNEHHREARYVLSLFLQPQPLPGYIHNRAISARLEICRSVHSAVFIKEVSEHLLSPELYIALCNGKM